MTYTINIPFIFGAWMLVSVYVPKLHRTCTEVDQGNPTYIHRFTSGMPRLRNLLGVRYDHSKL